MTDNTYTARFQLW